MEKKGKERERERKKKGFPMLRIEPQPLDNRVLLT